MASNEIVSKITKGLYEHESDLYASISYLSEKIAKNKASIKTLKANKIDIIVIESVKDDIKEDKKQLRQLEKYAEKIAIANLNFE